MSNVEAPPAWPSMVAAAGWPESLARPDWTGAQARAACARIVAERAGNFRWAFRTLPASRRGAMYALYAFCRLADDIADADAVDVASRRAALEALDRALVEPPRGPVLLALADAIAAHGIRLADLRAIVGGVAADLAPARIPDLPALHRYCYGVAGAVGLAAIEVFGHAGGEARAHAGSLGRAMQLTNVLRDVAEDARRGRVYLPADWLASHGCDADGLLRRPGAADLSGDWDGLLERLVAEARAEFRDGRQLLPLVDARTRACPAALAALYEALLDRMERAGVRVVLERRVTLPRRQKLALALRAWARHRWARA